MAKVGMNADILQDILTEYDIEIRYNEMTHREEVSDYSGILHESESPVDTLIAFIGDRFRDEYKYCSSEQIAKALHLIAVRHTYNPILEIVQRKTISAGKDYIAEYSHDVLRIPATDQLSHTLIRKGCFLQPVALLQNDFNNSFGADGIPVFCGNQGIGKSLNGDALAIDSRYYRTIGINPYQDEADILSKANGIFIGEFAELEKSLKPSTIEFFKSFITSPKDSYRPKYGRGINDYVRRSSYIGTCNTNKFLIDRTGNRRFWIIPCVNSFDIDRLICCKNGDDDLIIKCYKQAYLYLQENGLQSFRLLPEEREQVEARNCEYMSISDIEIILKTILLNCGLAEFTIAQLKESYSELQAFDNVRIGRILTNQLMLPQKTEKVKRNGKDTTERVYRNTLGLQ